MRATLLTAFVLGMAALLQAADINPADWPSYGKWRSSMMGGGGYLQNVVLTSDPQRMYAYVDVGGYYRSDDAGAHWRMMHGYLPNKVGKNEVRGLLVDPKWPDRIVLACGSQWASEPMGIYVSDDGGVTVRQTLKTWFGGNADFRWDGFVLARDPRNEQVLLAGTMGDGIWRSEDGGETWKLVGEETKGHFFTDVRIDREANVAYACALRWNKWLAGKRAELKEGFFRSDDGGKSWKHVSEKSPREMIQDPKSARMYGTFGKFVRASDDRCETWIDLQEGLPIDPESKEGGYASPHTFQAFAAGEDFVVLGTASGAMYRLQSGETKWTKVQREKVDYRGWFGAGRFGQALGAITIDPRDDNHWFCTDWFAIYETKDAGRNWTLRMDGVEVTVIHALGQDPADPGRVHQGMADNGYLQSTDGGVSFSLRKVSGNVKDVTTTAKLPARVYAVGTATWEWESNQVFVSIDAGDSWHRSPMAGLPDMDKARCNNIAANPEDPYEVYLGVSGEVGAGKGGPYRSRDGGKTWTWVGKGLPEGASFYADSIWAAGRKLAAGPGGMVMTISGDSAYVLAGDEWKVAAKGLGGLVSVAPDCDSVGRFIVTGDRGIYAVQAEVKTPAAAIDPYTQRVYEQRATYLTADMVKVDRFAASVHDGVIVSEDDGKTWTMLDKALPHALASNPLAFAGERLVAGSGGSGVFWIPLSAEGEKNVSAKPVQPVPAGQAKGEVPTLQNLDFAAGLEGWNAPWTGTGKITATVVKNEKPALRIAAAEPGSYGSIGQSLKLGGRPFTLKGEGKITGQVDEAQVAVQVFDAAGKQIAWSTIANLVGAKEWKGFSGEVSVPAKAANAILVITFRGDGAVEVRGMGARGAVAVWKE